MPVTIQVSTCCKANAIEDFKTNPRDHHDSIEIYICSKCKQECDVEDAEVEPACEFCGGTGKIETQTAPDEILTKKCYCQTREPEFDNQQ